MQSYSSKTRQLLEILNLSVPLIQAPMVGVSTPTLAAAVSATGALGSLGMGGGSPAGLQTLGEQIANIGQPPINLNFFVHAQPRPQPRLEADWLDTLRPYFEALHAPLPAVLEAPYGSFDEDSATLSALLELQPRVVSFHFGLPAQATMKALKLVGCRILATATSAEEATALEAGGVDAVIAQGWEAGGHRGHFLGSIDQQLSTSALVSQLTGAVKVPVIAAGGIGDGKTAAELMQLGAAGVQLGTAFVSCPESSASPAYRDALKNHDAKTLMTPIFSGREARGLQNLLTKSLHQTASKDLYPQVPDYPRAYTAGKALAGAAEKTGDPQQIKNYSAIWAGTACTTNRPMPAAELISVLLEELHAS